LKQPDWLGSQICGLGHHLPLWKGTCCPLKWTRTKRCIWTMLFPTGFDKSRRPSGNFLKSRARRRWAISTTSPLPVQWRYTRAPTKYIFSWLLSIMVLVEWPGARVPRIIVWKSAPPQHLIWSSNIWWHSSDAWRISNDEVCNDEYNNVTMCDDDATVVPC
jgi:hypothetical protein